MGTAIKHPVPYRVKPSFVIFDIRALGRSEKINATINSYPRKFLKRLQIPPPLLFPWNISFAPSFIWCRSLNWMMLIAVVSKPVSVGAIRGSLLSSWQKHLVQSVACAVEDETLAISENIQLDQWTINTFNTTNTVSRSNLHHQTCKTGNEFSDIRVTMFQML